MEIEVLNKKNNYYELYHVYEDKALGDKVVKFIGLFSSTQNAWKAIKASTWFLPAFSKMF